MQNFKPPIIQQDYIGMNDNLPPETLPNGYFAKVDNAFLSDNKITKVFGSSTIASSIATQSFNGFAPYENFSTNNKYLIANLNGASVSQLYSWNGSGNFSSISGGTSINNAPMWFETANNIIFGVNGTDELDWDGTTLNKNRSNFPKSKYLCWFHNYLFAAGDPSNQNRLYWSNLGDPTTFVSNTNFVDVNPGDGDKIMSLAAMQDQLIVFKRETVWSITGFSGTSFSSTTILTQNTNARIIGYGCIAPFSVVPVGNDVYFLSYLGQVPVIRSIRYTGVATTIGGGVISHDIDGTMGTMTKGSLANAVGTFDGRYCYWSIPINSSTTNNKIIVLDTFSTQRRRGKVNYAFTTMTGKNAAYFAVSTISGTAIVYFAESGTTGNALKFDTSVNSDKGGNIAVDVITRSFMPDPARKEKWKYLYFRYLTGNTTININAKIDEAANFTQQQSLSTVSSSPGLGPTGSFTLGISTLGGNTVARNRTTFQHLIGKTLQLEFSENSTSNMAIYDQEIYYQPKGLRSS